MTPLHSCGACSRHIRASERVCPFCQAPSDGKPARRIVRLASRLGTASLGLAFGASLAACYGGPPPPRSGDIAPPPAPSGTSKPAH